ncbi:M48 family metalloprotease [Flammeovirga yaeyamensis]|uniref:M48 family metalloprotease n=1 Tax=Flammeovirga yaeyamensis TaxID=367791 RepID=A0AAX1N481_9BACT|nr:M48 family metalloprotease [Flammeovirga yaeyamensis]MBB3699756.1 putative Zn-dependent protease [Flammeovirga yaeyamensis]NMF36675.1 M48 family metalloprotease [Flammeovirga yaeyamensis]QWG02280.1 M48 family metalloprotease [Flammeovirga yaeyamensis]
MKLITILLQIIFIFQSSIIYAQSIELDKTLGLEYANQVIQEQGVYQDEKLTAYVDGVGQKLVNQLEKRQFDYQFRIVPQIEPNAFALPGGYVFITTGLLSIIRTEDELAGILSHEIIHAHNRHSIAQMKKGILPKILELPGDIISIISKDLGAIFNAPIKTTNALYMASYGRKKETEADLEGMELAVKAGYTPTALKDILHRMTTSIELVTGEQEQHSYFNDHPYTPNRESDIELKASFMPLVKQNDQNGQYLHQVDGVLFGNSIHQGVFNRYEFLHPDLQFKVTFPKEWMLTNTDEYFGGYSQNYKEGIIINLEKETDVTQAVLSFTEKLSDKEKSLLVEKVAFDHGNDKGFRMSFRATLKKQENYANIGWVKVNGQVYRISNFSDSPTLKNFNKVIASFKKMGDDDYEKIKTKKISIVKSNKGETLQKLCKRSGNISDIQLIEVLNDKKADQKLEKGESIKIVKKYPYTSEKEIRHDIKIMK